LIDLIILVGTNPLPCYLSARYLWDTFNKDEIKIFILYVQLKIQQ